MIFRLRRNVGICASQLLVRVDRWTLGSRARAPVILAILIATYWMGWSGVSFLRHYHFHSGYDLAIMDQVVWNTSQGRLLARSIEKGVTNDLGDHVRPHLAALSLLYLFIPSPYILLAYQSFVLAMGALPLYVLARRKFNSPGLGLVAAFCFLAYPPLGFLNRYDFHSEVLSIPLLIAAYERIDVADLKTASVLMVLTLFTKENLGITVAAVGIMAAVYYRQWRFGFCWALVGIAYSSVALLVVIPAFRGAPSDTLARYQWLGDTPWKILWTIVSQPAIWLQKLLPLEHVITLFQLFAPLGFLSLLGLQAMIPAAPTLIYNFLAEWSSQATIYTHYMAPAIPFIVISAVIGLHRLATNFRSAGLQKLMPNGVVRASQAIGVGAGIMLLATVTSWMYENPIMGNASLSWASGSAPKLKPSGIKAAVPMIWPNRVAIREGMSHVPAGAALLTTANYAAHLSHRSWIEMIPTAPVLSLEPKAEAVFLNFKDLRWWRCDDYFETLRAAAQLDFGITFYRDDVIVVQKHKGDKSRLNDLLDHWSGCKELHNL